MKPTIPKTPSTIGDEDEGDMALTAVFARLRSEVESGIAVSEDF